MKFALRNFLQLEWGYYWLCRLASLLECELTHEQVFLLLLEMRKKLSMLVFAWNFEQIVMFSSAPTLGSWWMQWVVIAASHCHTSWRWWSAALWVMHKVMTSLILVLLVGVWQTWQWVLYWRFLQCHRYMALFNMYCTHAGCISAHLEES